MAFILLSSEAGACISSIKLEGSTFIKEIITVERTNNQTGKFKITFGKTSLSHNGKCWYNHESKKCLPNMAVSTVTDTRKQTIGVLAWDNVSKKITVYSSDTGVQDDTKPYLVFSETNQRSHCRASNCSPDYKLTVTKVNKSRKMITKDYPWYPPSTSGTRPKCLSF